METIKVNYNGFWGDTTEEVTSVAKAKTRARKILRENDRVDDVYIIKGNSQVIAKVERVDAYNGKFQCVTIEY